jgi:hypothetical protein
MLVEPQRADRPDRDDPERDGGKTAHNCIFVDPAAAVPRKRVSTHPPAGTRLHR